LSLSEKVAYTRSSHTYKHLHEIGSGNGEEWHIGLTRHGFCEKSLTGARRAYQQGSLGDFTPQVGIVTRIFKKLNNLLNLLFCFREPGNISEGHLLARILIE